MPAEFVQKNHISAVNVSEYSHLEATTLALLASRGMDTDEKISEYFHPSLMHDPLMMRNMSAACDTIRAAMEKKQKIVIYGDYDTDGVCAVSILLKAIPGSTYYIPHRHSEGYGLHNEAIDELKKQGIDLIITVDCGISSYEEVAYARSLGMSVIVTDHHEFPENLPDCPIVSAKFEDYPFNGLCGAGVAFKVACALNPHMEAGLYEECLQLAGIATVADIVPLVDENRAIAAKALESINAHPLGGVEQLIRASGLDKHIKASDIAFYLAPRINAAGRMDSAACVVDLFMSTDISEMLGICQRLEDLNQQRKALCGEILAEAEEQISQSIHMFSKCIILASENWNQSVLGIVASKLAEKYARPAFVFAANDGVYTGSARSIKGINLVEAITAHKELLVRFGGHEMAAGLTVEEENFEAFCEEMLAYMGEMDDKLFRVSIPYDIPLEIGQINHKLYNEIELFEPFGHQNAEPVFRLNANQVLNAYGIGSLKQHLRLMLSDGSMSTYLTAFNCAEQWEKADAKRVDSLVMLNKWEKQNTTTIQLKAKAIKPLYTKSDLMESIDRHRDEIYQTFFRQELYQIGEDVEIEEYEEVVKAGTFTAEALNRAERTLVLAFHPSACQGLIQHLDENALKRFDISYSVPLAENGTNSIVFGPDLSKINFLQYQRVWIYDAPNQLDFLYVLSEIDPVCEVMVNQNAGPIKHCFDFSREVMIKYYLEIKRNHLSPVETVVGKLTQICAANGICGARAALAVFEELGFITLENGKVAVIPSESRDLTESIIYTSLIGLF